MNNIAVLLISAAGVGAVPDNALLDFTATWCAPCRQMSPIVDDLIRRGHPVVKVDIDRHPALARKYGIRGIPAFVLVVNGKAVERTVGYTSRAELKRMLSKIPAQPIAKHDRPARPPVSTTAAARTGRNRFRLPLPEFLSSKKKAAAAVAASRQERPVFRGNLDSQSADDPRKLQESLASTSAPLAASVRIRVRDGEGHNVGSGTVIDSRPGRSIVLSCGHVFRELTKDGVIEVELFQDGRGTKYAGRLLKFDMKADVSLLSIATPDAVPVARLAEPSQAPEIGESVYNIGCPGGSRPSRLDSRVTSLNRYLGPDNLECTSSPKQGRSGGGLFNSAGRLVGVCFAADPPRKRGLYAGLKAIRKLIAQTGLKLSTPADGPNESPTVLVRAATTKAEIDRGQLDRMRGGNAGVESSAGGLSPFDKALASLDGRKNLVPPFSRSDGNVENSLREFSRGLAEQVPHISGRDSSGSLQTVDEIFGDDAEAEVVCIIRPLNDPQAASRIVVINRASSKFVRYLSNELDAQPRSTSKYEPNVAVEELVSPFQAVVNSSPGRYRRSAASR